MKYAVYWQPDEDGDIECNFFPNEREARARVAALILQCDQLFADNPEKGMPYWDITLLKVMAAVVPAYPDGTLTLKFQ